MTEREAPSGALTYSPCRTSAARPSAMSALPHRWAGFARARAASGLAMATGDL